MEAILSEHTFTPCIIREINAINTASICYIFNVETNFDLKGWWYKIHKGNVHNYNYVYNWDLNFTNLLKYMLFCQSNCIK